MSTETRHPRCRVNTVCRHARAAWLFAIVDGVPHFEPLPERVPNGKHTCCDACKVEIERRCKKEQTNGHETVG